MGASHGDDLDRQREAAEYRNELARIDDADEFLRDRSDDLLARERAAAALDHVHFAADLVGAIDVDRQVIHLVEIENLDAVAFEALAGVFGAGDGTDDAVLHAGQRVDEQARRRAGADADDLAFDHVIERGMRDGFLEFVLGHDV